jgi:hypothetical protein
VSAEAACQKHFNTSIINNRPEVEITIGEASIFLKASAHKSLVNDQLDTNRFLSSIFPAQGVQDVLLNFCGFTGLDLNLTLQSELSPAYQLNIEYTASSMDLYMNGASVEMSTDGGRTCDETQLTAIFNNTKMNFSVFSWTTNAELIIQYIKQSRGPLCALAFKNAKIICLSVYGPPLKFFSTASNFNLSEIYIYSFQLSDSVIEQLDATIIHPQVFTALGDFRMYGCSVRHIQFDLFRNTSFLVFLIFNLYNLKGFVHGNGIELMSFLGPNSPQLFPDSFNGQTDAACDDACQMLLSMRVYVSFGEGNGLYYDNYPTTYFPNLFYTFPDADFCIFANFSFNKLIVFSTAGEPKAN